MTSRRAVGLLALVLALPALPLASAQAADELPLGKAAWDVHQFDRDPVKVVKTSYDKDKREVRWVLEFQRDLTVRDVDWRGEGSRPPYWFRLEDADGVTLYSPVAEYDGVPVGVKGRRVRVVLHLPPKVIMARIKKVVVDYRPFGEELIVPPPIGALMDMRRPEPEPEPRKPEKPER